MPGRWCHRTHTSRYGKSRIAQSPQPPPVGLFLCWRLVLHLANLPTDCLQATENKKPRYLLNSGVSFVYLGWLMGLEPTTTGITILTLCYLAVLIDADRINTNQHLARNALDARTANVLIEIRQFLPNLPTDCLQIPKGRHEQATKPREAYRWQRWTPSPARLVNPRLSYGTPTPPPWRCA